MNKQEKKKNVENVIKTYITLEYAGIHIEDVNDSEDIFGKFNIYFSIPETNKLEIEEGDLHKISTIDKQVLEGLANSTAGKIIIAKEGIKELICGVFRMVDDDPILDDIEKDFSKYFRFNMKIRKGEVWTNEKAKENAEKTVKALEEAIDRIKKNSDYKEV